MAAKNARNEKIESKFKIRNRKDRYLIQVTTSRDIVIGQVLYGHYGACRLLTKMMPSYTYALPVKIKNGQFVVTLHHSKDSGLTLRMLDAQIRQGLKAYDLAISCGELDDKAMDVDSHAIGTRAMLKYCIRSRAKFVPALAAALYDHWDEEYRRVQPDYENPHFAPSPASHYPSYRDNKRRLSRRAILGGVTIALKDRNYSEAKRLLKKLS